MSDEFRSRLVQLAERLVGMAPRCKGEEGTKLFLVLPFLNFLGYDDRNPNEVCPEYSADFSEKYKNRVDFAILREDTPIIAIECKAVGEVLRDDRGQLRSYFNAAPTVKMGVLTDGLLYEFFADSDEPNMMDQAAFLTVNLREVAAGRLDDSVVEGLAGLRKEHFDPDNIGAEARRKLVFQMMVQNLNNLIEAPTEAFTRLVLANIGMANVRSKALCEYQELLLSALRESMNQKILKRLSIPLASGQPGEAPPLQAIEPAAPAPAAVALDGIVTTEGELAAFAYAKRRLAFLVKDEEAFEAIERIEYKDFKGKFVVFYKRERKGRLFDLVEGGNPRFRFTFPGEVEEVLSTDTLTGLDGPLLKAFMRAVQDEGNL